MSTAEQENLEVLLARAMYTSGTAFHMFNSPKWQLFFRKLRPSFKLPTSYKFSTPLLEAEYNSVKTEVNNHIKESSILSLQTDAWSNIRNDSINNYLKNTPKPVFFETIHTKENRHTSEFLLNEMQIVMEENGIDKFLGVVTDDGANIKAREMLCEKFNWISEYPCVCSMTSACREI